MNFTIDWASFGISISIESVQKQMGDHATDRKIVNDRALIPTVVDVELFMKAFGGEALLDCVNGTSLRVKAQAVARRMANERDTMKIENALMNMLRGIRSAANRTQTVIIKHALPNGKTYDGTDLVEYQQAYAAALVDAGIDTAVALNIAKMQTL